MMLNDNVFFFLIFKNDVRFFYDNLPLNEALSLMKAHGFTAVPVIRQDGTYAGSVSEGDFLWFILKYGSEPEVLESHTIHELIREGFIPPALNTISFDELLGISLHQNYVPIIDDRGIFIGIVTRQAILNYFLDADKPVCMNPAVLELERLDQKLENRRIAG